ncbi:MAG: radical SAM protein, partial [Planctomycetes bacterium]|nr:radical SAM protein [Planctomycetota bacterium]
DAVEMPVMFVARLADLKAYVQVSLDGPDPGTNDPIRGVGTFDKIIAGIDLLLAHGFGPRMRLFVALTQQSIGRARRLVDYADDRGIDSIYFSQLNNQGRAKSVWNQLAPTTAQWVRFGTDFLRLKPHRTEVRGNVFGGLDVTRGLFPRMRCEIPSAPRIDCVGNVYPCQLFVEAEHRIGNIRKESLSEILNGSRVRELADRCSARSREIDRCKSCKWRTLCHSGCPGHAYSDFGTLTHEDSLCDVRLYWFEAGARKILGLPPPEIPVDAPLDDGAENGATVIRLPVV